jgi:hypothetical protein
MVVTADFAELTSLAVVKDSISDKQLDEDEESIFSAIGRVCLYNPKKRCLNAAVSCLSPVLKTSDEFTRTTETMLTDELAPLLRG